MPEESIGGYVRSLNSISNIGNILQLISSVVSSVEQFVGQCASPRVQCPWPGHSAIHRPRIIIPSMNHCSGDTIKKIIDEKPQRLFLKTETRAGKSIGPIRKCICITSTIRKH